ncbi:MAG: hypothetical protein IPG50_28360 [Myxococcales bacterium]|nr:hypothetical protein [Myxococcales bacterium]
MKIAKTRQKRPLRGLIALVALTTACELITGADDLFLRERPAATSDAAAADAANEVDANVDGEAADGGVSIDGAVADASTADVSLLDGGANDSALTDSSNAIDANATDASATDASDAAPGACALAGCDPKATCSFVDASVVCSCPSGYGTPDDGHTCVDINECSPVNPCGNGTCTDLTGGFSCSCPGGGCVVAYAASGPYKFRVPSGVSTIQVHLWGAGGGASIGNNVFGGGGATPRARSSSPPARRSTCSLEPAAARA